jgi:hypothetical protein
MEPHGLSPWYLHKKYPPTPLGAETLRCVGAKASEGYPPLAKSAEATSFDTSRVEAQVTHSSTGRARGLLRRRIKKPTLKGRPVFLLSFPPLALSRSGLTGRRQVSHPLSQACPSSPIRGAQSDIIIGWDSSEVNLLRSRAVTIQNVSRNWSRWSLALSVC